MSHSDFKCVSKDDSGYPGGRTLECTFGGAASVAGMRIVGKRRGDVLLVQTEVLARSIRLEFHGLLVDRQGTFYMAPGNQPALLLFTAYAGEEGGHSGADFLTSQCAMVQYRSLVGWHDIPYCRWGFELGIGKVNLGIVETEDLGDVFALDESPRVLRSIQESGAHMMQQDLLA